MVDVNNTIALGVKPYGGIEQQLNPMNMLLAASQLRNSDTKNQLEQLQVQATQQQLVRQNEEYRVQKVGTAAREVLDAPEDQRPTLYKQKLDELLAAKVLDPAAYQRALTNPPDVRTLTALARAALPPEQQMAESDRDKASGAMGAYFRAMQPQPKPQSYFGTLASVESGNNPNAVAALPAGSGSTPARGVNQIKEATWRGLATNYPDAGLTEDGFNGKATDSADQHKTAVRLLTVENAQYLRDNDVQPTDKNLRMAHLLGAPKATEFIKGMIANPNAPATSLVSSAVVKDNPAIFLDSAGNPKTAAGVYNSQTAKFAIGSTLGLAESSTDADRVKAATDVLNNRSIDPATKALVLGQISPNFGFQTTPDGTIIRTNPRDGSVVEVYKSGKPKFTQISEGMLGDKQFGYVDEAAKKTYDASGKPITPDAGASSVGKIPVGADGEPLKGPELLAHLEKTDPAVAAGVKGVIAGDINAGGRNLQKLLPLAKLIDPTLEQYDYQTRAKTEGNFKNGPESREIKAINTAIYHAGQLAQTSDKLGGINVLPGVANPIIQGIKRNMGDQTYQEARKNWDATSETLSTEIAKALNGGAPHAGDKEHWRKVFEAAGSPQERDAAISSAMKLLEGRTHALAATYERGKGRAVNGLSFIDKPNQAAFEELMSTGKIAPKPKSATPASIAAPAAPDAPAAPAAPGGVVDWQTYFGVK